MGIADISKTTKARSKSTAGGKNGLEAERIDL